MNILVPLQQVFNFASPLSNLDVSDYFSNPQTCKCKEPKFCYEPHGYCISVDLRAKLRQLVAKGLKVQRTKKGLTGKLEKQYFFNPLIFMQNIIPRENT